MTDLQTILTNNFPKTQERIKGRLVFLRQHGFVRLNIIALESVTQLEFYKAKFFTGYRKFTTIDAIVGMSNDNNVFLLTNPLFSDEYSDLVKQFEKINSERVDQALIMEIVNLYRETGAKITEVGKNKYQIWLGDDKWRVMEFEINGALKIKTTPNSTLPKAGRSWLKKLLGSE